MQLAVIVSAALAELPPWEREIVSAVRWRTKPRPAVEDLERGCKPEQLGAFFGFAHERHPPDEYDPEAQCPPILHAQGEITLFLENIRPLTAERVRVVFLHELAHALGYTEEEITGTLGYELEGGPCCQTSGC